MNDDKSSSVFVGKLISEITANTLYMENPNQNYMVGCAAVIVNEDNEVLLCERTDYDGNPVWALFGGKPEASESLAIGIAREIFEEVNLNLTSTRYSLIAMRESKAGINQPCITAYYWTRISKEEQAQVKNMEPHKCKQLRWVPLSEAMKMSLWQNCTDMLHHVSARLIISEVFDV